MVDLEFFSQRNGWLTDVKVVKYDRQRASRCVGPRLRQKNPWFTEDFLMFGVQISIFDGFKH